MPIHREEISRAFPAQEERRIERKDFSRFLHPTKGSIAFHMGGVAAAVGSDDIWVTVAEADVDNRFTKLVITEIIFSCPTSGNAQVRFLTDEGIVSNFAEIDIRVLAGETGSVARKTWLLFEPGMIITFQVRAPSGGFSLNSFNVWVSGFYVPKIKG